MTNAAGRVFVGWYYRASPPIAEKIRGSSALRLSVQGALLPTVGLAWLILHPGMGITVLVGAAVAGWLWSRQHRKRKAPRA
jgi:hypothetical protein